jgi:hypothetical protein
LLAADKQHTVSLSFVSQTLGALVRPVPACLLAQHLAVVPSQHVVSALVLSASTGCIPTLGLAAGCTVFPLIS